MLGEVITFTLNPLVRKAVITDVGTRQKVLPRVPQVLELLTFFIMREQMLISSVVNIADTS